MEFFPFIDYNCISFTDMCIFIRNRPNVAWPRCDGNNNCGQIIVQSLIPKIFIAGYISYLQTIRTPKKKSVRFFTVYAKTVSNTEIFSCVCQTAILIQAPCALSPIAGDPYTPVVCHQHSRLPLYLYGSHPEKIKENII